MEDNCDEIVSIEMAGESNRDHNWSKNNSRLEDFASASNSLSPTKAAQVVRGNDAGGMSPAASVVHLEEIELVDMRSNTKVDRNKEHKSSNVCPVVPNALPMPSNTEREFENKEHKIKQSNFQPTQKDEHGNSRAAAPPMNNPELLSKVVVTKENPKSSLSVPGRAARNSSSKRQSRSSLKGGKTPKCEDHDDDDEDISMASLSELLGAVRQYAKEIHEIYAPIKKDEEERIRKRNERIEKRKNKNINTCLVQKSENQPTSPNQHEVQVDIHALEDKLREKVRVGRDRKSAHETFPRERSHDLLSANPVASLHVENEKLSSTWPRGQRKSTSRERFWSDITLNNQNPGTSWPRGSGNRPNIPAEWSETSSLKHEKEIFEKAFRRLSKSNDPLVGTSKMAPSLSQKVLTRSRQNVAETSKQNQKLRETALPIICIIPPLAEHRRMSVEGHGGVLPSTTLEDDVLTAMSLSSTRDGRFRQAVIPSGPAVFDDPGEWKNVLHQSKNGGAGVKSSSKAGLRRRKSVEQGLGQPVVPLEKY